MFKFGSCPSESHLCALALGLTAWMFASAGCKNGATSPIAPPDTDHVVGANCAGCHEAEHQNWSGTLHSASAEEVLLNTEHNEEELLTDECLTCHAPFQAGTYSVGDFVQPADQAGPWRLVEANAGKWEAIKCEVCHDPLSTNPNKLAFYDSASNAYADVDDITDLCEKCHQPGTDDSRDLAGSVHEGLQCTACHLRQGARMRLDPRASCSVCHPRARPNHPDVTHLDTTYRSASSGHNIHFVQCGDCHVWWG